MSALKKARFRLWIDTVIYGTKRNCDTDEGEAENYLADVKCSVQKDS